MMKEIRGYEGQYSITIDGRIWSHKRKNRLKGNMVKPYEKHNITRTHYYNILINKKWKN